MKRLLFALLLASTAHAQYTWSNPWSGSQPRFVHFFKNVYDPYTQRTLHYVRDINEVSPMSTIYSNSYWQWNATSSTWAETWYSPATNSCTATSSTGPQPHHPYATPFVDTYRHLFIVGPGPCSDNVVTGYVQGGFYFSNTATLTSASLLSGSPSKTTDQSCLYDSTDDAYMCVERNSSNTTTITHIYCTTMPVGGGSPSGTLSAQQTARGVCTMADAWMNPTTNTPPAGGADPLFVWDANSAKAYLYGGYNNHSPSGPQTETWSFDPVVSTWTNLAPANTPPVKPSGNVVGWGGDITSDGNIYYLQTLASNPITLWVYSIKANNWLQLTTSGTAPPSGQECGAASIDTSVNRLVAWCYVSSYPIVYEVQLPGPDTTVNRGLGRSTLTCVDVDGDGYGTGSGCLGPDSNDFDSTIHTGAQALSKWGTMQAYLLHMGYSPGNIWYESLSTNTPAGNDSTGVVNDPTHPFLTCCGPGKANPAAGDMVMFRGGVYATQPNLPSGTSRAPTIAMGYPGELPSWQTDGTGFKAENTIFQTYDGFQFNGNALSGGGLSWDSWGGTTIQSHDIVVKHIESLANEWGIEADSFYNATVEYSAMHDTVGGSNGEQGLYFANHAGLNGNLPTNFVITGAVVKNNLVYNNGGNGVHFNGRFSGAVIQNNEFSCNTSNVQGSSITFETGVVDSTVESNVSILDATFFTLYEYSSWCTVFDPMSPNCPYGQTGNLIVNNTIYTNGLSCSGATYPAGFQSVSIVNDSGNSTSAAMGSNTFRNLNLVNHHIAGFGYAPIHFGSTEANDMTTTTIDHVNLWNSNTSPGTAAVSMAGGRTTFWTCAQALALSGSTFGSVSDCNYANPNFVSASVTSYNPTTFNLNLSSGSPAIHVGTTTKLPAIDLIGNPFAAVPSIGGLEFVGGQPPAAKTCDLNADGVVNILDVQIAITQAIGVATCGSADLNGDGLCNSTDVQVVVAAALGGACQISTELLRGPI